MGQHAREAQAAKEEEKVGAHGQAVAPGSGSKFKGANTDIQSSLLQNI